jgi:hypothetical protein
LELLKDPSYNNLDESGLNSYPNAPATTKNNGKASIASILQSYLSSKDQAAMVATGREHDRIFVDEDDCFAWSGPIRWFRGTLATIQSWKVWQSEHELLYFRHASPDHLDYAEEMRSLIFDDMILYGYILPNWIPLLSRFQCRKAGADRISSSLSAVERYHPYHKECMEKWSNVRHFVE